MKTRTTEFEFTSYEQQVLINLLQSIIDGHKETLELFRRNDDYVFVATFEEVISDYENILSELNKYKSL